MRMTLRTVDNLGFYLPNVDGVLVRLIILLIPNPMILLHFYLSIFMIFLLSLLLCLFSFFVQYVFTFFADTLINQY